MAKQQQQQGATPKRGIVTDTSFLNQPTGALTFALNTVNITDSGDKDARSNEQSNELCYTLDEGYIPIGEVFIDKDTTVIFSCNPDTELSEIGVAGADCKYTTHVRAALGFKPENQISATYRLRRGCERVLYFTTPTPMTYNLDKPQDFKVSSGITSEWDIDKFFLFKIYESIPNFETVEIQENGFLTAGSYNASIQYLDDDLNPTEWITTSEPIKIYNNSNTKDYETIRGSTSVEDSITNFGITNKSIKFSFSNFDDSYPFYRVAIIEANTGNGLVSAVKFSAPISTSTLQYTYSGSTSAVSEGTEEEILFFNNVISKAGYIDQIENRLILGDVKGTQINFCEIQKFASRIKTDLTLNEIDLNGVSESNPKTETVNFDGTGYMPGEIYSFGIVYIFEDSTTTPVYHIPGRSGSNQDTSTMSKNNYLSTLKYQDNSNCADYWGKDADGTPLKDTPVRHHRFPLRSEIGEELFTKEQGTSTTPSSNLTLSIKGKADIIGDYQYRVNYTLDGVARQFNSYFITEVIEEPISLFNNIITTTQTIVVVSIEENINNTGWVTMTDGVLTPGSPIYKTTTTVQEISRGGDIYKSNVMGIKFTNIVRPPLDLTNNKKVVGYYIVRNERTEDEKTILDSGVVTPMLIRDNGFVTHSHIFPELADKSIIDKDIFGLIHPEHKFLTREYRSATDILIEGYYEKGNQSRSSVLTQDVGAGTSYDPDIHKSSSNDYNGFSLHTLTRDTEVSFNSSSSVLLSPEKKGEIFYLNALNSKSVKDSDDAVQDVFNVSGDNKIGIIKTEVDVEDETIVHDKLPYVILKRTLSDPYFNYRNLPFYKDSKNPIYFGDDNVSETEVLNGDSYITPMKYHSAIFNDFRLAKRETPSGTWKIIVGAILVVVGVVATIVGVGPVIVTAGVALLAAGLGASAIASGIETNQISKVYEELYKAGLKDSVQDDDTEAVFGPNPEDDEMQWTGDAVTNLWFESSINMGLRNGVSIAITDFIDAPGILATEGVFNGADSADEPARPLDSYLIEKLTVVDTDNGDGRLYKGYAGAELYALNLDYQRLNKQKIYYALGIEYDCCSECLEDFPQRVHFSEQSFQEELTDNYRSFLPNNYRDIEGEKGVITNIFRIQNNLYIHTESALWHLPQNIQERVTGDVVSFIGTGDFFSIPPRKITDADKESAGTLHNWATMKTQNGVFFVNESERKIFLFDGNSLNPIMSGNEKWFSANMELNADRDYKLATGENYPGINKPSSAYGTGFISVYDTENERFILTKKDFILSDRILNAPDFRLCAIDNKVIIFENFNKIIEDMAVAGWSYVGLNECKMMFIRVRYLYDQVLFEVEYQEGLVVEDPISYDMSWTMSYSLEDKEWVSWHSYLPSFYFYRAEEFYSWKQGMTTIWKHNVKDNYQTFYGTRYPHIIEYVDNKARVQTKVWDYLNLNTRAVEFNQEFESFVDRDITFNKMIAFNSKQTTGLVNLKVKEDGVDYLEEQVTNDPQTVNITRAERNWYTNDIRDVVVNYDIPFFRRDLDSLKAEYFTDKVLNENAIDYNKNWYELQSFRDKYLVIRLIFDNFDNIRLSTDFTEEMANPSQR